MTSPGSTVTGPTRIARFTEHMTQPRTKALKPSIARKPSMSRAPASKTTPVPDFA
jgi:hypothetical protein